MKKLLYAQILGSALLIAVGIASNNNKNLAHSNLSECISMELNSDFDNSSSVHSRDTDDPSTTCTNRDL